MNSIIIPAFNEAECIENAVKKTRAEFPGEEIIVVDDGSTDNTKKIVDSMKEPVLISYKPNKGKGFAVRKGIDFAKGKNIAILDADLTVRPKELKKFFFELEKNKNVFLNGNRINKKMETNAMPAAHVIGNKIFAWLFRLTKIQIHDALCGTKAFSKKNAKKMQLKENSWPDFELLAEAKKLGLEIREIDVEYKARKKGKTKMKTFRHGFFLLLQFIRLLLI